MALPMAWTSVSRRRPAPNALSRTLAGGLRSEADRLLKPFGEAGGRALRPMGDGDDGCLEQLRGWGDASEHCTDALHGSGPGFWSLQLGGGAPFMRCDGLGVRLRVLEGPVCFALGRPDG